MRITSLWTRVRGKGLKGHPPKTDKTKITGVRFVKKVVQTEILCYYSKINMKM